MKDLYIRSCQKSDFDTYCKLYNRVFPTFARTEQGRNKAAEELFDDPFYSLGKHVLAFAREELVGSATARIDPAYIERNGPFPYLTIMVDRDMQRKGIGSALLDGLECSVVEDYRGLDAFVDSQNEDARLFLTSKGFTMIGRGYCRMECSISSLLDAPFPSGFVMRQPVLPDDLSTIVDVMNASFSTNTHHIPFTVQYISTRPYMLEANRGGSFLLFDGDRLVATSFCTLENSVIGGEREKNGGVYALCVVPGYRGRGLARFLLLKSLLWIRSMGGSRAFLYMDNGNTAARNLYHSLGFVETEEGERYRKTF